MKRFLFLVLSLLLAATASALTPYVGPVSTILTPYPAASVEAKPLVSTLDMDGRLVVGWVEHGDGRDRLLVSMVGADGAVDRHRPAELTESIGTLFQSAAAPAMAYNGEEVLAAFITYTGKAAALHTARLDRNLTLLDSPPVTLAFANDLGPLLPPTVSWNGTDFLVAWGSDVTTVHPNGSPGGSVSLAARGVTWTRVRAAGVGTETRLISFDYTASSSPHCGFSPAFCTPATPARGFLRALTLDQRGVFNSYGSSTELGAANALDSFALASSPSGSVAAILRADTLQTLSVDGGGSVQFPQTITTLAPGRSGLVIVASSGSEWLVVYEDIPFSQKEPALFGAFLDAAGKLMGPPVRLTAGAALSPSLLPLGNGVYRLIFAHPNGTAMDIETMLVGSHAPGRTRTIR